MTAEQLAALAGFHQLNKAQLNGAGFDPGEEGVQLMVVDVAHQHRIDFDLLEPGAERRVDAVHHLAEFILAGNGVKLAGVETVHADVNGG